MASWMRAAFEMRSSRWPTRTDPYRYDTTAVSSRLTSTTAEAKPSAAA